MVKELVVVEIAYLKVKREGKRGQKRDRQESLPRHYPRNLIPPARPQCQ